MAQLTGRETPYLLFMGSTPHAALVWFMFSGFFLLHSIGSFLASIAASWVAGVSKVQETAAQMRDRVNVIALTLYIFLSFRFFALKL